MLLFLLRRASLPIKGLPLVKPYYTSCSQSPLCPSGTWKCLPGVFSHSHPEDRGEADRPEVLWPFHPARLEVAAIQLKKANNGKRKQRPLRGSFIFQSTDTPAPIGITPELTESALCYLL